MRAEAHCWDGARLQFHACYKVCVVWAVGRGGARNVVCQCALSVQQHRGNDATIMYMCARVYDARVARVTRGGSVGVAASGRAAHDRTLNSPREYTVRLRPHIASFTHRAYIWPLVCTLLQMTASWVAR